jgi:hypothetical protein
MRILVVWGEPERRSRQFETSCHVCGIARYLSKPETTEETRTVCNRIQRLQADRLLDKVGGLYNVPPTGSRVGKAVLDRTDPITKQAELAADTMAPIVKLDDNGTRNLTTKLGFPPPMTVGELVVL